MMIFVCNFIGVLYVFEEWVEVVDCVVGVVVFMVVFELLVDV